MVGRILAICFEIFPTMFFSQGSFIFDQHLRFSSIAASKSKSKPSEGDIQLALKKRD
ncbi:hypothetical protein GIB67_000009 [Kingdonia uniflora]|uniref:Uncharacterized protein n=1 Tax=Kingdonia uniflora TaxID=39325 RepID=A0A7J7MNY3_9MAGN|nr:hypothetical protein GIB67_000009 [Kingdonia uniflora]